MKDMDELKQDVDWGEVGQKVGDRAEDGDEIALLLLVAIERLSLMESAMASMIEVIKMMNEIQDIMGHMLREQGVLIQMPECPEDLKGYF